VKVALFFLLLWPHSLYAASYMVATDAKYPAGSRMQSPWTGLVFSIPKTYQGSYQPLQHVFQMHHSKAQLLLLLFANSNKEQQLAAIKQSLKNSNLHLQLKDGLHITHPDLPVHITRFQGSEMQGGAIISLGHSDQTVVVQQLLASMRWQKASTPERAWTLSGRRLSQQTNTKNIAQHIDFCSQQDAQTYKNGQSQAISWALIYDVAGEPLLLLQHNTSEVFSLKKTHTGLQLNQQPFELGSASCEPKGLKDATR